jgi:hypothetical protein
LRFCRRRVKRPAERGYPIKLSAWKCFLGNTLCSVRDSQAKEHGGIQRAPVSRIVPYPPHAFAGVQYEALVRSGPRLGREDLADVPFYAGPIDDEPRLLAVGGLLIRPKDVAVCIYSPGHLNTYERGGDGPANTD